MLASYILYDDLPLWILLLLYVAILIFYYLRFRYSICLLSLQCREGECFLPKEIDKIFVRSTNISQPRTFTTYWWALFRKIQSTAADDFFSSTSFRFKEKPSKKLFNLHKNDGNYQSSPRSDYIRQIKRDKSCLLISTSLQLEASSV